MIDFKDASTEYRNAALETAQKYAEIRPIRAGDLRLIVEYARGNGMTIAELAKLAGIAPGSLNHALHKDKKGEVIASYKFYRAVARVALTGMPEVE